MKMLICTQKADKNDDLLGFFHGWIAEFARQCESVTVVCLYKGEVDLSDNVRVLSLGKEKITDNRRQKTGLVLRVKFFFRFYKYIWQERKNYDAVFVHMNPIYVILGGLFWRLGGKRIGLWYAHGHVPLQLRVAEKFCDHIFTSTPSGCRLRSDKIRVVGQGVAIANFQIPIPKFQFPNPKLQLITIGRISPVKDLETLIKAVDILRKKGESACLRIIGSAGLAEQEVYKDSLVELVKKLGLEESVVFTGSVPNPQIPGHLKNADIFVSASRTGSLDKVFLEAIAAGLPVIGCNEALLEMIKGYEDMLFYPKGDADMLAERVETLIELGKSDINVMLDDLRACVKSNHSANKLVKKIIEII